MIFSQIVIVNYYDIFFSIQSFHMLLKFEFRTTLGACYCMFFAPLFCCFSAAFIPLAFHIQRTLNIMKYLLMPLLSLLLSYICFQVPCFIPFLLSLGIHSDVQGFLQTDMRIESMFQGNYLFLCWGTFNEFLQISH